MEIGDNWRMIQKIFDQAFKSCFHYAIGTVNQDGSPHVTPIGGLFLRDDRTGFYFEEFPSKLPENLKLNSRVCILAVNADKMYWGKGLLEGKLTEPPGVRLLGAADNVRTATKDEIEIWHKRVGFARAMKGYKIMWEDMSRVRDIRFDAFEPIYLGEMTRGLW